MSIQFEQVTKRYRSVPVVNDVTLEVTTGEFFVLLGPSGSGKSTLLRAVAGLTAIDHGRIALQGRDVTYMNPRARGVGFVFQHYALFRNMTVAENIEFALRVRRMRAARRRERCRELLRLVALDGMDDRLPSQLSGGQQQRVAVARALAHEPAVLLLDEPFGALDAKIRVELRRTIRDVQRRLGTTTILVTHDQEEAFSLADRIGIMHMGRLLETGSPQQLYRQPATRFVATFLGAANLLLGKFEPPQVRLGAALVGSSTYSRSDATAGTEVVTVVRPEDLELAEGKRHLANPWMGDGNVVDTNFAGGMERLVVRLAMGSDVRAATGDDRSADQTEGLLEVLRTGAESTEFPIRGGQQVAIGVRRVHILPTPISSFFIRSQSLEAIAGLRGSPLLTHLARSMQAHLTDTVTDPDKTEPDVQRRGVIVVESGPAAPREITQLVKLGANRILCLPRWAPLPKRVVIYCPDREAQPATMRLVASLVRHLHAETTLVSLVEQAAPRSDRAAAFRRLLNARAEVRAAHGLDLRTELHAGTAAAQMRSLLTGGDPAMLVVGTTGSPSELQVTLARDFGWNFAEATDCPIFFVHSAPRAPLAGPL